MISVFEFEGYGAVIPQIQNIYGPKPDRDVGWCFGFKYSSGVFEFFSFKTEAEATAQHQRLLDAVDSYWTGRAGDPA
ncbi:hypothetical protein LCGC14_0987250 [marine sediment metagenome]|uniref:Uncharacterized protein n=2 Tax=root TaxID=1 RepID=A0A9C9NID4_9HYPH|nr:hypothetical protein [Aurantimonas coralicida]